MRGEPRAATVAAASEVIYHRLDKASFQTLLQRRPALAEAIAALLAEHRGALETVAGEASGDAGGVDCRGSVAAHATIFLADRMIDPLERRINAILALDIAGYTRLMGADEVSICPQGQGVRPALHRSAARGSVRHRGHDASGGSAG